MKILFNALSKSFSSTNEKINSYSLINAFSWFLSRFSRLPPSTSSPLSVHERSAPMPMRGLSRCRFECCAWACVLDERNFEISGRGSITTRGVLSTGGNIEKLETGRRVSTTSGENASSLKSYKTQRNSTLSILKPLILSLNEWYTLYIL